MTIAIRFASMPGPVQIESICLRVDTADAYDAPAYSGAVLRALDFAASVTTAPILKVTITPLASLDLT